MASFDPALRRLMTAVAGPSLLVRRLALVAALAATASLVADGSATRLEYAAARELAKLEHPAINESSGLAAGRINPDVFWTHNDSGGGPRLFAFDKQGRSVADLTVPGARARDWEDMASFRSGDQGLIVIGDVGDNKAKRKTYTLYVLIEPKLTPGRPLDAKLPISQTITFEYDDGPHDCEAIAVDPTDKTIYLVNKAWGGRCNVYTLAWPNDDDPATVHRAALLGTLSLPTTTAMDMSPDGRRAIVLTYGDAYEYARAANETWKQAFARPARRIKMPRRAQGETICYGADGKTLYLTSECKNKDSRNPSPLLEVLAVE